MSTQTSPLVTAPLQMLLGDEAIALGAVDAGITVAYAYPGTPSTEIVESLIQRAEHGDAIEAHWCTNEKTAFEQSLGVSMMGRRVLVAMKHVGLNVASDPFINSALCGIRGGLVLVVADDPGMHSSQNEQDSRFFADFARIVCLEPATQQEAYDMTREAFELSERFRIPVMLRIVTRLCHGRSGVRVGERRAQNPLDRTRDPMSWILLPANARRLWRELIDKQDEFRAWSEASSWNTLELRDDRQLGVITTGRARTDFRENLGELDFEPSHLHIGAYPIPVEKVRALAEHVDCLLVIEEGFPLLERQLRGLLPTAMPVLGKEPDADGKRALPPDGELTPGIVRVALGLPALPDAQLDGLSLPIRPPQLCTGCPHGDAFTSVNAVREECPDLLVTADIGCYTLGALPPYKAIESCVCMGASIGMAKGAVDAGAGPVIAVIGDSTFLHSGVTPLMDAVSVDTNMTLLVLDNETVAMTGAQPTILSDTRLGPVVEGLGVPREHCHVFQAHPKRRDELTALLKQEIGHQGLSVIIVRRECIVAVRRRKEEERQKQSAE